MKYLIIILILLSTTYADNGFVVVDGKTYELVEEDVLLELTNLIEDEDDYETGYINSLTEEEFAINLFDLIDQMENEKVQIGVNYGVLRKAVITYITLGDFLGEVDEDNLIFLESLTCFINKIVIDTDEELVNTFNKYMDRALDIEIVG